MDNLPEKIFALILSLPAFVAAFTVHEFAHAWSADRLGDDTPRRMGRVTLDPVAHLDPLGSIMFLVTQLSGYGIGWAKPVPVNSRNLGNPNRDDMLVALAGPVSNLLQVPFWLGALWLVRVIAESQGVNIETLYFGDDMLSPLMIAITVLSSGVWVNILLAAFNMIPIPPLDGHWVLQSLFPPIRPFFATIYPWSFLIVLVLANTGILGYFIYPFLSFAGVLISRALGLY
ncbi:MAG TPA: site-2 protease family protein [Abditibacteriaceae bacterium]|jgi:Zn-dependent protease